MLYVRRALPLSRHVAVLIGLAAPLFAAAVCVAERPNIILCMGDDHGWEETGYNGHPHLKTPVLDEMAASGLRFDHFYAAHPSCSPTRGSVLTGRHPNRYGTFTPNYSTRPQEITIAHLLSKAGYACGHFGKWHVGPVKRSSPTSPGALGFQSWLSHDNFFELNPVLSRDGGPPQRYDGESSEVIVDEAIRFIRAAKGRQQPFFAVIWFGSPHEPYSGLPADLALYDDLPVKYDERSVRLTSNETGTPTRRKLRAVLRERFAEITAMDRAIGKLRDYLRESKQRDNTLLWYCGDNGTPSSGLCASPFRGQKGQMYEGGIRVPGLIEWPAQITQPTVCAVNAVTSDMLPTICGITAQTPPARPLDGLDLRPVFNERWKQRPEPIYFWEYQNRKSVGKPYLSPEQQRGTTPLVKLMRGVATRNFVNFHHTATTDADYLGPRVALDNQFKLVIHDRPQGAEVELFDLRTDPAETKNLALQQPDRVADMKRSLRAWQHSVLQSLTGADYE